MYCDRLSVLAKRARPPKAYSRLQFDTLDPIRGQDRMFVMKLAKDPKDLLNVDQYARDVKTQLASAEFALQYNKQVCCKSCTHAASYISVSCVLSFQFAVADSGSSQARQIS